MVSIPGNVKSVAVLAAVCLVLLACGAGRNEPSSSNRNGLSPRRANVTLMIHCLRRHGFWVRNVPLTPSVVQNVRPRPSAWLMFLSPTASGVALFYASGALARAGAARWDREEQARVCDLLGEPADCAAGVPRYEFKRTRDNVFLNFNLGTPSKASVRIVEECVTRALR
jgi:hypothetical protein